LIMSLLYWCEFSQDVKSVFQLNSKGIKYL